MKEGEWPMDFVLFMHKGGCFVVVVFVVAVVVVVTKKMVFR